jgi:cytochrome c5
MKKKLALAMVVSLVLLMGAAGKKRVPADADGAQQAPSTTTQSDPGKKNTQNDGRGAQLFETHCGRCHKPPEDLSPRTAPAVLSHMRTRAMLSREDEELILKFLAP